MPRDIVKLLESHGPSLTSTFLRELENEGISPSNARKLLSRAHGKYKRLAGVRLNKNQRFIYTDEQFGTRQYWEALEKAFYIAGKSYWAAIVELKAQGGMCNKKLFPRISGNPAARKGQLSPQAILERLQKINLVTTIEQEDGEEVVRLQPIFYHFDSPQRIHAVKLAENIALLAVKEWARKIGFGSYHSFTLRGDESPAIVSGVAWDLTAPSYMRPLVSRSNDSAKPGFFVCDINLRDVLDTDVVEAFIRKYNLAAAPLNVAPIMAFLIANNFTTEGYELARKNGILAVSTQQLFGIELARSLIDLVSLFSDMGNTAAVNPDHVKEVVNRLSKIEGAADNLRSDLFELAVGMLVKDTQKGYMRIGRTVLHAMLGQAEIDVLLDMKDRGLLIIECKAKISGGLVSEAEIKKWYESPL